MSDKIEQFITDTKEVNPTFGEVVASLRTLVQKSVSDFEEGFKYGGIIFSREGTLIGGIFVYKKHISFEFSFGAGFTDPEGILEGSGKLRRHIKLTSIDDIIEKKVREFLEIAFS